MPWPGSLVPKSGCIGRFGVAGSAWFAALLSLGAAGIAFSRSERLMPAGSEDAAIRTAPGTHSDSALQPVRTLPLLACSFLSGATLLALEVVWFRFLTMYVLSTTLAASLMLGVVLAGIGLGGLAASAWLRRNPDAARHLPFISFAAGCVLVGSYAGFQVLTEGAQISVWYHTLWLACVLTLPVSALSGVLFTLLGDALQRAIIVGTRAAGSLALANTAGGMCGPLVAAFVMLPLVGLERTFFAMAVGYLGVGGLALFGVSSWRPLRSSPALVLGAVAIMAALVRFPFGLMADVYFKRVAQPVPLSMARRSSQPEKGRRRRSS